MPTLWLMRRENLEVVQEKKEILPEKAYVQLNKGDYFQVAAEGIKKEITSQTVFRQSYFQVENPSRFDATNMMIICVCSYR